MWGSETDVDSEAGDVVGTARVSVIGVRFGVGERR